MVLGHLMYLHGLNSVVNGSIGAPAVVMLPSGQVLLHLQCDEVNIIRVLPLRNVLGDDMQ